MAEAEEPERGRQGEQDDVGDEDAGAGATGRAEPVADAVLGPLLGPAAVAALGVAAPGAAVVCVGVSTAASLCLGVVVGALKRARPPAPCRPREIASPLR